MLGHGGISEGLSPFGSVILLVLVGPLPMPPVIEWAVILQWLPIIVSLVALGLSTMSLWKGYLTPFRLEVAHSSPCFCLYKITPRISGSKSGKGWWIPSFDVGLSFYNGGQKIGRVTDVRIKCDLRSGKGPRTYLFSPKWVVSYASFTQHRHYRIRWIDTSVERDWYPLILPAKETKHVHLILESHRWDEGNTGEMEYTLQVFSSESKEWKECARYRLWISEDMYESQDLHHGWRVN